MSEVGRVASLERALRHTWQLRPPAQRRRWWQGSLPAVGSPAPGPAPAQLTSPAHCTPQGSGGTVDPASLSGNNPQAATSAVQKGVQGEASARKGQGREQHVGERGAAQRAITCIGGLRPALPTCWQAWRHIAHPSPPPPPGRLGHCDRANQRYGNQWRSHRNFQCRGPGRRQRVHRRLCASRRPGGCDCHGIGHCNRCGERDRRGRVASSHLTCTSSCHRRRPGASLCAATRHRHAPHTHPSTRMQSPSSQLATLLVRVGA